MSGYLVDSIVGWLRNTPASVLEAKRNLADLLKNDMQVDAYQILTTQEDAGKRADYQRALQILEKNIAKKDTKKNNLASKVQKLGVMYKANNELQHEILSDETIELGVQSPSLFMHVTNNVHTRTCYEAMSLVSQKIFDGNKSAYNEPSSSTPIVRQEIGGTISMNAAKGFSRLGLTDECRQTLQKHKNTYGYPEGDFVAFIEKQDRIPENNILAIAALQIEEGRGFSLETMEKVLRINTFDDALNCKIVDELSARQNYNNMEHEEAMADIDRRAMILIDYLKTPVTARTMAPSHTKARDALHNNFKIMNATHEGRRASGTAQKAYYDMVFEEIPADNPVVLDMLKDTSTILSFVYDHTRFKYDTEKNRIPTKITDLIPSEKKGPQAGSARNNLAKKLFESANLYYKDEGAPTPKTSELMSAAVSFTNDVLLDTSLPIEHPIKKRAMFTMREIILAQRIKQKDAAENFISIKNTWHSNAQDVFEKSYADNMEPVSLAGITLYTMSNYDNPHHKEVAEAIQKDVEQQWRALNIGPVPKPFSLPSMRLLNS